MAVEHGRFSVFFTGLPVSINLDDVAMSHGQDKRLPLKIFFLEGAEYVKINESIFVEILLLSNSNVLHTLPLPSFSLLSLLVCARASSSFFVINLCSVPLTYCLRFSWVFVRASLSTFSLLHSVPLIPYFDQIVLGPLQSKLINLLSLILCSLNFLSLSGFPGSSSEQAYQLSLLYSVPLTTSLAQVVLGPCQSKLINFLSLTLCSLNSLSCSGFSGSASE